MAAKIEPRRKALPTDMCRAHCNVRWVERHCRVPDGASAGQPFRLLEFQRGTFETSTATRVIGRPWMR